MKGFKTILGIALATATFSGVVAFSIGANSNSFSEVNADTAVTLYYAVPSSIVGSYTVKVNANIGDNNTWRQYNMTKLQATMYGYDLYQGTIQVKYGGVDALQFQLYSGNTWKSQEQPYSSWTTSSTFSGKTYIHSKGWANYATDTTYKVYFDAYDWSNLYVHAWHSSLGDFDTYPGNQISFTDPNLRFNGGKLQSYTFKVPSSQISNFRFNYNSGSNAHESSTFSVTNKSYYWHNGSNWVNETGDIASAAKYVDDFNTARLQVASSASVKEYSICGLDLGTWYSKYTSLTNGAQTKVKGATILTYAGKSSTQADTTVSFEDIINYMASYSGSGSKFMFDLKNNNTSLIAVVTCSIGIICLFGVGYYILKKKRY